MANVCLHLTVLDFYKLLTASDSALLCITDPTTVGSQAQQYNAT